MSQLFGQIIYTSFAGVGFKIFKSEEIPPEVQQFFLQQLVYKNWDAYDPPSAEYKAVYLYQISAEQTLFGWLYNDGFDDFGRAHIPYFICYYFAGKLQPLLLENIFTCLQTGIVSQVDREITPDFIEGVFIQDFNKYIPARQGIAISTKMREESHIALQQGMLLNLFISNNAEVRFSQISAAQKKLVYQQEAVSIASGNILLNQQENKQYQVEDYRQILINKTLVETTGKGTLELPFPWNKSLKMGYAMGIASLAILIFWLFSVFNFMTFSMVKKPIQTTETPTPTETLTKKVADIKLPQTITAHTDAIWSAAISKDGKTLASGSKDRTIKILNLETSKVKATLRGHTGTIKSLALTNNDQILVSSSSDGTIKIWNLQTNQLMRTVSECFTPIDSVAVSPDGNTIISGDQEGKLRFWNLHTGKLTHTVMGHRGQIFSVAINPNGKVFASGGIDKKIKIWNLQTGKLISTIPAHTDTVRSLAFNPDGTSLASGSWDKTVKVWNWQTGELLQSFDKNTAKITSVNFSNNGRYLVTGGMDNNVKIWNLQNGKLLQTLAGHTDWVLGVVTNSDKIVSVSKDKTVRTWDFYH
ncbi:MAG: WD40 repeat domain-containing protein [Desmonostoc vinosum HA7617-LM4]|jgi:WD40 repeat protein|nr:WD40 repeat domain-containing protein [Desmonostoc vinosum HA7617-LM4]